MKIYGVIQVNVEYIYHGYYFHASITYETHWRSSETTYDGYGMTLEEALKDLSNNMETPDVFRGRIY